MDDVLALYLSFKHHVHRQAAVQTRGSFHVALNKWFILNGLRLSIYIRFLWKLFILLKQDFTNIQQKESPCCQHNGPARNLRAEKDLLPTELDLDA